MTPKKDEVLFTALGGAGEIGMNFYAYGHDGTWLAVDCGVSFGDPAMPGIDVFTADPSFLEEEATYLSGLVITHAHEDHIGGVVHLWPFLRCPIYLTPFAAEILKGKLQHTNFADEVPIHPIPLSKGGVQVGSFDLEFIHMPHSIPEAQAIIIRTAVGTLLHTGDWKIDANPQVGPPIDKAKLKKLGDDGLLALIGDSTNAMESGYSASEEVAGEGLAELIARQQRRVAVGCFATNVARIQSLGAVAKATGRSLILVGRSLHRVTAAARATGYLSNFPDIVPEDRLCDLPPEKVLIIATGSQGEEAAALARVAADTHPTCFLEEGDTVVFSSRIIPGNERDVGKIQNAFARRGIQVLTEHNVRETVHVTGHPMRGEMSDLLTWTRPRCVVPVHGEWRHMVAHAELAKDHQVPHVVVGGNGAVIRMNGKSAQIIDRVYSGRLALDGDRLIDPQGPLLPQRRRLSRAGTLSIAVVLDPKGALAGPVSTEAYGCLDHDVDMNVLALVRDRVAEQLARLDRDKRHENGLVEKAIVYSAKRVFADETGKKPLVIAHIIRL